MEVKEVQQKLFLESVPPGQLVFVTDFMKKSMTNPMHCPEIELHCDECDGVRFYSHEGECRALGNLKPFDIFLEYICKNCTKSRKTFAIWATYDENRNVWAVLKYGEVPGFGPPIPTRALSLLGGDRELFLKGRRCENQGLGVAAFAYYRRVIESQKSGIFDEIIRVGKHLSAEQDLLDELEKAKLETQFVKSVNVIKKALPQSLLINGFNPLNLLHSALSRGLHDQTDEECLEVATSIRIVLVEFADRLAQAMKDDVELKNAVNRLAQRKST